MIILNNLKQFRLEKGLTVRELSRLSGISYPNISKIENGYIIPSQITMMCISKALKMNTEEVFILDWEKL